MNRTLKDVTVHRYFYQTHAGLQEHLDAFINASNFAKRLKTLRGLTPYEYIVKTWTEEPERFITEPYQLTAGLYIDQKASRHGMTRSGFLAKAAQAYA